jgi:hypothetical protein
MQILISYLFLLSLVSFQPEGKYERHNQYRDGLNGVHMAWSLKVNKDKTFTFSIKRKTSNYLSKASFRSLAGSWRLKGDTLILSEFGKTDRCLSFHQKGDTLMFAKHTLIFEGIGLIYPDYMTKAKDN